MKNAFLTLFIFTLLVFQLTITVNAASISNISDNKGSYANSQIPTYEKFEVTFQIQNSTAKNYLYPYVSKLPDGMNATNDNGITVTGIFIDPDNKTYQQPGFYYEGFDEQTFGNKQWFYPNNAKSGWKVRFSPNKAGTWQYYIKVTDSSGTNQTSSTTFSVAQSDNKGFIKVSDKDSRYFEFDNGEYFAGTGYNKDLENIDPIENKELFSKLNENGISLVRTWLTQFGIYGSAWGHWYPFYDQAYLTQEPIMFLANPQDAKLKNYTGLVPPQPVDNHDVYLWLNFDKSLLQKGFNPCQMLGWEERSGKVPVKQNTKYRVTARFNAQQLEGPMVEGKPYGFAVKYGGWLWNSSDETKRCYAPGQGTVIAASYPGTTWTTTADTQHAGWQITQGTFNSGSQNFLDHLYLTMENVKSKDSDLKAGHVFVDEILIQEDLGNGNYGPNIVYKPNMGMHTYVNQRDALALDKTIEEAHESNIYIKGVMNEKNDYIFQTMNFDGSAASAKDVNNFFGNGRETSGKTKARFLQEAWWRYIQARWGYSTNIHSWELLNEGPDGLTNHHILTDEFGKFMHCRAFGVDSGTDCNYNHPNDHMITTSFSNSKFPILFWKNASGAYPDVDFADLHAYAFENTTPTFNDEAAFSAEQSETALSQQLGKPIIRGETGWQFSSTDAFNNNVSNGLWLHNFLWAGLNSGGLIEHYWNGPPTNKHIWNVDDKGTTVFDHHEEYKRYTDFIKELPLNNGQYKKANVVTGNAEIRAYGQVDSTNSRGHLWIQNSKHTWKNVASNITAQPINTTVSVSDFKPNASYKVQWWDTYTGTEKKVEAVAADNTGKITLNVVNLNADVAVKIGDFSLPPCELPTLAGDLDNSGKVNLVDLTSLVGLFGKSESEGDLNCDFKVNFTDISILLGNLGK